MLYSETKKEEGHSRLVPQVIYIHQNSSNCTLKTYTFYCMKNNQAWEKSFLKKNAN